MMALLPPPSVSGASHADTAPPMSAPAAGTTNINHGRKGGGLLISPSSRSPPVRSGTYPVQLSRATRCTASTPAKKMGADEARRRSDERGVEKDATEDLELDGSVSRVEQPPHRHQAAEGGAREAGGSSFLLHDGAAG